MVTTLCFSVGRHVNRIRWSQFFWDMYINRQLPEVPVGDWAERYDVPQPGLPRTAWYGRLTDEQLQRMRAAYMGCISHIDYQLGYLLEMVQGGLDRNLMMVFTADHGDMLGDHNLIRKCYAYEGSARIPFVVKYPNSVDAPAGTFEHPVGLQDVMPTILEATGTPIPDSVTGTSVLKAARGEPWRDYVHGEHSPCYSPDNAMQYLTDGKEKYIWFPVRGEEQFFDLANDRQELHDRAHDAAFADRVSLWRNRLIAHLGERGDGFSDGEKLLERPEGYGPVATPSAAG